jgi:hypothetical protein
MAQKITINEAARLMGKSQQFLRIGLQRGIFPFGTAIKLSSMWTYYINPKRFYEYIGEPKDEENDKSNIVMR